MSISFYRRNLPHLYFSDGMYFITYRLENSIPVSLLSKLQKVINKGNDFESKRIFKKYDSLLVENWYDWEYTLIVIHIIWCCSTDY